MQTATELLYHALGQPDIDKYLVEQRIKMLEQRRKPGINDDKTNKAIKEATGAPFIPRCPVALCCFCGVYDGSLPAKKIISSGFTNVDLLRNPNSEVVCDYCVVAIKTLRLRQSSWVATLKGITYLSRDQLGQLLFGVITPPFIFNITTSFKKLGQIKAPMNDAIEQFMIQFEDEQVAFNPAIAKPIYKIMQKMYSIPSDDERKNALGFFTKTEMRTGDYKYGRIKQYGQERWEKGESILRRHRNAPFFKVLLHALNQEKLGIASHLKPKKEKTNGTAKKARKGPVADSKGSGLPDLEIDSMGQCKWFS